MDSSLVSWSTAGTVVTAPFYLLWSAGSATIGGVGHVWSYFNPPPPPSLKEQTIAFTEKQAEEARVALGSIIERVRFVVNEYPNPVAAGLGLFGFFFTAGGLIDIYDGKEKKGILKLALGILGIGSGISIQKDVLPDNVSKYKDIASDWVIQNILEVPYGANITGGLGAGSLLYGAWDYYQGNKKFGAIEIITGISLGALGLYGMYFHMPETCSATAIPQAATS